MRFVRLHSCTPDHDPLQMKHSVQAVLRMTQEQKREDAASPTCILGDAQSINCSVKKLLSQETASTASAALAAAPTTLAAPVAPAPLPQFPKLLCAG
mmetsp:Transcript_86677/g.173000  ORF Transcript_86677/g.173000 Transcript_86677/m.173000 type:complete len:97 (+) Transcript_86677:51-341(+)